MAFLIKKQSFKKFTVILKVTGKLETAIKK